jgi:hypothetical protein
MEVFASNALGHAVCILLLRLTSGKHKQWSALCLNLSSSEISPVRESCPEIQWLQSYVTGDKVYCVYIAPNEKAVREHAQQGGFPANRVSAVVTVIDPTTAE